MTLSAGSTGTTAMVSGPNVSSPVDGTVVNWHTEGFTGTYRLRVIQLGSGNAATASATGPSIGLSGGTSDQTLSVPIKQGEVVGFDNSAAGDTAKAFSSSTYASSAWGPPALSDNGSPRSPAFNGPLEFAENATVRYCLVPAIKGKKLGAAKHALSAAACSLGKVKKNKGRKGKKGKKAKFVRSQSVPPGTSLGDGAAVDVKLGKKAKKKR